MTNEPGRSGSRRAARVVVSALALAAAVSCERREEVAYTTQTTAGPFEIAAALEPEPPAQRGNELHLRIRDDGEPVEGADVQVGYLMPAMGAMPEMRGRAHVEDEGDGRYVALFDLPMGGSWSLELDVRADGRSGRAVLGMRVGARGLRVTGDGPPIARAAP